MVTIQITCRHCGGENIVRNGMTSNSKQRFLCKDCRKNSRENPQPNGYTDEKRVEILRASTRRDPACAGFPEPAASRATP